MKLPRIRWRKPPEVKILELIEKHVMLCVSASDELLKAVEAKAAKEGENAWPHIKNLYKFGEEADAVKREITTELAKGILPPLSKEDLMRLVGNLDMIVDWSKDAGRILEITSMEEFTNGLKVIFVNFTKKVNQCVHVLGNVTQSLYTDYRKALEECFHVEAIEDEIDLIYVDALKVMSVTNLRYQTLLLANELARALEMTADCCEDTAGLIRVTIVSTFR